MSKLRNKSLLTDKVAISASIIAKNKKIRNIVHNFRKKCAYSHISRCTESSPQMNQQIYPLYF